MNDYIQKNELREIQRLYKKQLLYSAESVVKELKKENGFSLSYLEEHSESVYKYFHCLKKEFRLQ